MSAGRTSAWPKLAVKPTGLFGIILGNVIMGERGAPLASELSAADLLLHPIRMRIVQALLGRELTTGQLREVIRDVPPATLYRQIGTLLGHEVLHVVAEQRVRGAVQRTYALNLDRTRISADELAAMDRDQHRRAFSLFVAGLLADTERYLARPDADPVRDNLGYTRMAFYASDPELQELIARLREVVRPYIEQPAGPGRRRMVLSTEIGRAHV